MGKRSRSAGVRDPVRRTVLFGLGMVVGIALVLLGIADMRSTGAGSPLVVLGLFPALLCPIFLVYYLTRIQVFRGLRSGRDAIARWTLPPGQFLDFCREEQRIPAHSVLVNVYRPPRAVPEEGVEVIFSRRGVLIGGGYFPLSASGGRRLQGVRYNAAYPPSIQFDTLLSTSVRTSSVTVATRRTAQPLRVPVALDARSQAGEVVDQFEAIIAAQCFPRDRGTPGESARPR